MHKHFLNFRNDAEFGAPAEHNNNPSINNPNDNSGKVAQKHILYVNVADRVISNGEVIYDETTGKPKEMDIKGVIPVDTALINSPEFLSEEIRKNGTVDLEVMITAENKDYNGEDTDISRMAMTVGYRKDDVFIPIALLPAVGAKSDPSLMELRKDVYTKSLQISPDVVGLQERLNELNQEIASLETKNKGRELTSEELGDNLMAHTDFIKGLTAEGKLVEIDSGEEYVSYKNVKTGEVYQRTTQLISNSKPSPYRSIKKEETFEEFESFLVSAGASEAEVYQAKLLASAQVLGTKLDVLVRDVFAGIKVDHSNYDVIEGVDAFKFFVKEVIKVKNEIEANGETILPGTVVLFSSALKAAGTVDVITYGKDGSWNIYDMKSMRTDKIGSNRYDSTAVFITDGMKEDGTPQYRIVEGGVQDSDRTKHSKQLSIYSYMLQETYGVKVDKLAIIPLVYGAPYQPGDTTTDAVMVKPRIPLKVIMAEDTPALKKGSAKIAKGSETRHIQELKAEAIATRQDIAEVTPLDEQLGAILADDIPKGKLKDISKERKAQVDKFF